MIAAVTSGTIGQTVIRVADIIDHALRRAGLTVGQNSPDISLAARNNLYFLLSSLSNEGVNLWEVDKTIIGLIQNQAMYALPVGTIDVLKVLYRTLTFPSGGTPLTADPAGGVGNAFAKDLTLTYTQTNANGYIGYNFGQSVSIRNVGIMPSGTQTFSLVWEYSTDGVTWTATYTSPPNTVYPDNQWVYADIDGFVGVGNYFRVRETGGAKLSVRAVIFGRNAQETTMGRMNLDNYSQLVQKNTQPSPQPVQYWFDRQRVAPTITFWQCPSDPFMQIVCWRYREIQDVGTLQNVLEIPQRWQDAVVWELAMRMLFEIPGADMTRLPAIQQMVLATRGLASAEERDNSPVNIAVDLTAYTS